MHFFCPHITVYFHTPTFATTMESHAKEIPLSRQMCASYDAYIAALPLILSRHHVDITRYAFDGEKHLHMDFVGAQLERQSI